jgi:hypothetical protein
MTKIWLDKSKDVFPPSSQGFNYPGRREKIDNFTKVHKGYHVLFSGCSITMGCGLSKNYKVWTDELYTRIEKYKDTTGFFSIPISGASIFEIIINVFRYISNYGNPDVIFLLLPNNWRLCKILSCDKKNNDKKNNDITNIFAYNIYSLLDSYCINNNILLISSTWDFFADGVNNFFVEDVPDYLKTGTVLKDFESFYNFNKADFENKIYEICQEYKDNNLIGNDGSHPNFQFHYAFADFFEKIFLKKLTK